MTGTLPCKEYRDFITSIYYVDNQIMVSYTYIDFLGKYRIFISFSFLVFSIDFHSNNELENPLKQHLRFSFKPKQLNKSSNNLRIIILKCLKSRKIWVLLQDTVTTLTWYLYLIPVVSVRRAVNGTDGVSCPQLGIRTAHSLLYYLWIAACTQKATLTHRYTV